MCAEMGKNVGAFPRKYAKADMVHVATLSARTRSALLPEFSVHGNEVDETSAHPQLIKSDSRLMLFEPGTKHVRVEGDHLFQIGDPDHDMVDILHREPFSTKEPLRREALCLPSTPETRRSGQP